MENNSIQPTPEKQGYQTLGKKVFWLFFLQISPAAFVLLLISIILFILSFQPFLLNSLFGNIQKYATGIALIAFMLFLVVAAGAFALAWLTYINYVFLLGEDSFKIKRGILNKAEGAIPYRQIQNVDIERSFAFQMLGLSRLIVLTAGHEDEPTQNKDEAEGVIPALDKNLAEWLQTELLKRAEVQKTVQTNQ